jgi:hypothetical protein
LVWNALAGANTYLLQIDTSSTFNSTNLRSVTVASTSYSPVTPLSDGTWYWRIAANDSAGVLGVFSATWSLIVETVAPTWVVTPVSQTLAYGQALSYQLQASDPSGIGQWQVNDTVHFTISSGGLLTNASTLASGRYGVAVTVYDIYNNPLTATLTVTAQAQTTTTTPTQGIPIFVWLGAVAGIVAVVLIALLLRRKP